MIDLHLVAHIVETLLPRIQEDKIPLINLGALNEQLITKPFPWVFAAAPHTGDTTAVVLKWFRDN